MTLYVPFDQGNERLGGWLVTQRLDGPDKQRKALEKLQQERVEHSSNPCLSAMLGSGQWSDFGEFFFGGSTQFGQVVTVYKGLGKEIMGEQYRDPGNWLYFDFEWAEGALPSEDSDPHDDYPWRGSSMHLPLLLASWTFLHPQDDPEHDLVVFATGEITGLTRQDFAIQPAGKEAIRNKARGFLEHLKSVQKRGLMLVSVDDVGWLRDRSETYPEALSVKEHAKIVAALRGANENPVLVSYSGNELVDIIALLEKISAPTERRPHFDGLCWKHTEQPVGWVGDPCTVPGCGLHLIPRKLVEESEENPFGKFSGRLLDIKSNQVVLTRILSKGGLCAVYLARMKNSQELFDKDVVVKLAFEGENSQAEALERESGVYQALKGVATERVDTCKHLFMEALGYDESVQVTNTSSGGALIREYNSRLSPLSVVLETRLDVSQRARLIHALLEGVNTLHKEQIFHGDLKPGNILVDRQDLSTIKFIDMATTTVLKVTGERTQSSTQFGRAQSQNTPLYAPPEVLLGSSRGTKEGDLFSLGLVLIEIVSNRRLKEVLGGHARLAGWKKTLKKTVRRRVWVLLSELLDDEAENRKLENLKSVDWKALLSERVVPRGTMSGLIVILLIVGLPVTFWTLSNQRTNVATEPTPPGTSERHVAPDTSPDMNDHTIPNQRTAVATEPTPPDSGEGGKLVVSRGAGSVGVHGTGQGDSGERFSRLSKKKVGIKALRSKTKDKVGDFCDEDNVRRVVGAKSDAIKYCFEKELQKNPKLSGRIIAQWNIGTDGAVMSASIASSTMKSPTVESCITRVIKDMRFQKPDGGICVINYPFIFSGLE